MENSCRCGEKPILFSGSMVKAILGGRKTMTRRVMKPRNPTRMKQLGYDPTDYGFWIDNTHVKDYSVSSCWIDRDSYIRKYAPYKLGDILWVRETWAQVSVPDGTAARKTIFVYRADDPQGIYLPEKWHSSMFMPRAAARIFLRVTKVKVERLQAITPYDAHDEGIKFRPFNDHYPDFKKWLIKDFSELWDSINAKRGYSWDANPWVWVYEFERVDDYDVTKA